MSVSGAVHLVQHIGDAIAAGRDRSSDDRAEVHEPIDCQRGLLRADGRRQGAHGDDPGPDRREAPNAESGSRHEEDSETDGPHDRRRGSDPSVSGQRLARGDALANPAR
jgi:hypothetical protein